MTQLGRRDFLRITVVGAAATGAHPLVGCSSDPEDTDQVFPQGVASGDPRPSSVVLWTRVEPTDASDAVVSYEVALDEQFEALVAQGELRTDAASDFTVRLKVTDLEPHTRYHYRFAARGVFSDIGRTKTAPAPDADVPVRMAFASCQDYVGRYFHSWRTLAEEEELDFVLFLGDYIYETDTIPDAQIPTDDRSVSFPDGLAMGEAPEDGIAARSLADYRLLYRTYRTDPDLKEAHRLYPFVTVWDDHEFANDAWQDRSNHFDGARGSEQDTERRQAATQAWFEYLPVDVEHDTSRPFPDDIQVYRSFRFGKHVDLCVTDQRYYRDDHLIPEGPSDPEVGKARENTQLGARILAIKEVFDQRETEAPPTMLGATQRDWVVEQLRASDATWKLLGSQTMLAQLVLDLSSYEHLPGQLRQRFYFKLDQWDGYRTERTRILEQLADVPNVVALTGDLHAFYASELKADFDTIESAATAVEYLVTGISAISLQEQIDLAVRTDRTLRLFSLEDLVANMDELVMEANPHIRYTRNQAYGYAVVEVDRDREVRVDFVHVQSIHAQDPESDPQRVRFRTPLGSSSIERLAED